MNDATSPQRAAPADATLCPECHNKRELVCDPTGTYDWYHCHHCNPSGLPKRAATVPTPGGFGLSELLYLLMRCQSGETTCIRALEIIDKETVSMRWVNEQHAAMLELCHAIEGLPASEQQTALSVQAAKIASEMQRVIRFDADSKDLPILPATVPTPGDTPRTDAEATVDEMGCLSVSAKLARELELELIEARRIISEMQRKNDDEAYRALMNGETHL